VKRWKNEIFVWVFMNFKDEKKIGEDFVCWYNKNNGTNYSFDRRGEDPPDLVFIDDKSEIFLEVTTAYYDDGKHAKFEWNPKFSRDWVGCNSDLSLVKNISSIIDDKCQKDCGQNCILIIGIYPNVTSFEEFIKLIPEIRIPQKTPFLSIYIAGVFPEMSMVNSHYRCIRLR